MWKKRGYYDIMILCIAVCIVSYLLSLFFCISVENEVGRCKDISIYPFFDCEMIVEF